jgi:hypothetical protein
MQANREQRRVMDHVCDATYILPIRRADASHVAELAAYLTSLPAADILVIDGSPQAVFAALHAVLPDRIRHIEPSSHIAGLNGKARGVLTGLPLARFDRVVIADDDVRYDVSSLHDVVRLLREADVVRPQNYFDPAPWHAVVDGARSLVNRALDGDWPGTLGLRRDALPRGYNADVLFENFEMVRTIRAAGGRERVATGVFVRRLPPSASHYWSQRVRQAYDEFARPPRMLVALSILPVLTAAAAGGRYGIVAGIAGASLLAALAGWLRDRAWRYFSFASVLCAPLWLLERGTSAWLALYQRCMYGGVHYAGGVIRDAATPRPTARRAAQ